VNKRFPWSVSHRCSLKSREARQPVARTVFFHTFPGPHFPERLPEVLVTDLDQQTLVQGTKYLEHMLLQKGGVII